MREAVLCGPGSGKKRLEIKSEKSRRHRTMTWCHFYACLKVFSGPTLINSIKQIKHSKERQVKTFPSRIRSIKRYIITILQ